MVLRHYPLRSKAHAQRKIFRDRRPRSSEERDRLGWHIHYDQFTETDNFCWDEEDLVEWTSETLIDFLPELLFRVGQPYTTISS